MGDEKYIRQYSIQLLGKKIRDECNIYDYSCDEQQGHRSKCTGEQLLLNYSSGKKRKKMSLQYQNAVKDSALTHIDMGEKPRG